MLSCAHLSKTFLAPVKRPGFKGALSDFFSPRVKAVKAVKDFSLTLSNSGIAGLLGPNGSGKTTLMKMFSGLVIPDSGALRLFKEEPQKRSPAFRKSLSFVMGNKFQLNKDIPVINSYHLFQRYYEIEDSAFKKRLGELSERLRLQGLLRRAPRTLSLGERMKLELAAGLLHNPRAIFLDEPTLGLDISSAKSIRSFLKEYHADKKPLMILTSHYMGDVEALCEKMILIIKGEKRFEGARDLFKRRFGGKRRLALRFSKPCPSFKSKAYAKPGGFIEVWSADSLEAKIYGDADSLRQITLQALRIPHLLDFQTEEASLEDIMEDVFAKNLKASRHDS